MERYNQGFLGFGLMEQCKDGKWVRYNDVENVLRQEAIKARRKFNHVTSMYYEELDHVRILTKLLKIICTISIIALFCITYLMVKLYA